MRISSLFFVLLIMALLSLGIASQAQALCPADCDEDGEDAVALGGDDCDDNDNTINTNATEICDTADNDCDGETDEGVTDTFYEDADGDNFGNSASTITGCSAPLGYVSDDTDCDDTDADVNPDGTESCNGVDDDCDGTMDEDVLSTFYQDSDSDGFGDAATTEEACSASAGFVSDDTDCDDTSVDINTDADETCDDDIDQDCDGSDLTCEEVEEEEGETDCEDETDNDSDSSVDCDDDDCSADVACAASEEETDTAGSSGSSGGCSLTKYSHSHAFNFLILLTIGSLAFVRRIHS